MAILKTVDFKGITVENAVFTVDTITIQGGQLDFFVSMRAKADAPMLDGENYGCSYDPSAGTPEEQAYSYLKSLEKIS
ncbi:hypothetical protein [Klebsiella aerogenes]|uniref:hypothetical protein n=1 Tax=Klebsiella aerogenes TaxID=548 RepID=UPI003A973AFF